MTALGPNHVHFWRVPLAASPPGRETCLSTAERSRAARFIFDRDRERWIASRVFLRSVLERYSGIDAADVKLATAPGGKPHLVGDAVRFNLSHSGDLAVCAVAREREVGADVELLRVGVDTVAIARRAFSQELSDEIASSAEAERTDRFFAAWTQHEARVKCFGSGLTGQPGEAEEPVAIAPVPVGEGYAAAVAVAGAPGALEVAEASEGLPGFASSRLSVVRWLYRGAGGLPKLPAVSHGAVEMPEEGLEPPTRGL